MKKIIIGFLSIFLLVGCSIGISNTPSLAVENYLDKYINSDDAVMLELDEYIKDQTDLTDEQKETYKEVLKKQYNDLEYDIQEENYDGDTAIVTVKITVYDLYKVQQDTDNYLTDHNDEFVDANGKYDANKYLSYRLEKMKNTGERVDYTIDINVSKVNNKWSVDQLSNEALQKIHGIYSYDQDNSQ